MGKWPDFIAVYTICFWLHTFKEQKPKTGLTIQQWHFADFKGEMCGWHYKINGKHPKGHTHNHIRNPFITKGICYTSDKLSQTYLIGKSFVAQTIYTKEIRILLNLKPNNDYINKGQVIVKFLMHYSFFFLVTIISLMETV